MFDDYDNTEKKYEIIFPDKSIKKYTTQELYEFFIFNDLFSLYIKKTSQKYVKFLIFKVLV